MECRIMVRYCWVHRQPCNDWVTPYVKMGQLRPGWLSLARYKKSLCIIIVWKMIIGGQATHDTIDDTIREIATSAVAWMTAPPYHLILVGYDGNKNCQPKHTAWLWAYVITKYVHVWRGQQTIHFPMLGIILRKINNCRLCIFHTRCNIVWIWR